MKYYQVMNKIKGSLPEVGVIVSIVILTLMYATLAIVWLLIISTLISVMPKTTIGVLIVAGIAIACLVSVHNTRGMMP